MGRQGTHRRHQLLASPVTGYEIDRDFGWFGIVQPYPTQNLDRNPSFETGTTGYTALNSTLSRVLTQQRRGAYSLEVTPTLGLGQTAGVYYDNSLVLAAGQTYHFSLDIKGVGGIPYVIAIGTTGAVILDKREFYASGRWERVSMPYHEATGATRRLYVYRESSDNLSPFYVDGWQMENGPLTTYCDGDQVGLIDEAGMLAYTWDGTPHASTSRRAAWTRAGGKVVKLKDAGFHLLAIVGLGLSPVINFEAEYAQQPGGLYRGSRNPSRTFTLVGEVSSSTPQHLNLLIGQLQRYFDVDQVSPQQPVRLIYQPGDCNVRVWQEERVIDCQYVTGLEGNIDNNYAERIPLTLKMYTPYVAGGGQAGVSLTTREAHTFTAGDVLQRDATGNYSIIAGLTGGTASLNDILIARDGSYYVTGSFNTIGGVAAVNFARYDPITGTWSAPGDLNGTGERLVLGPDGRIWVVGAHTTADGGASLRTSIYDPVADTWSQAGGGVDNGTVRDVAFTVDGTPYITGSFTAVNGGTAAPGIAKMNTAGTAWVSIDGAGGGLTGATANGYALAAKGYIIYIGGDYTAIAGTSATDIGTWNHETSTAVAMGSGSNSLVSDLEILPDGSVVGVGPFTTVGGQTVNYIFRWSGSNFSALGSGLVLASAGTRIEIDSAGRIYSGRTASGLSSPDQGSVWNGSQWLPVDYDWLGSDPIDAIAVSPAGVLTLSNTSAGGTGHTAATTTVTNTGDAPAYPVVTVEGPGRIYVLKNYTTGREIYFDDLPLQTGETLTLDFRPDHLSFTTNFRGSVENYIIPGSDEADFFLQKGTNYINLFVNDASATARMVWAPQYKSIR